MPHPFKGDYVRLQQNLKWKKMAGEMNDLKLVFADIVMKINRKNGKVRFVHALIKNNLWFTLCE